MPRCVSGSAGVMVVAILAGSSSILPAGPEARDARTAPGGVLTIQQVPDIPRLALQNAAQNHPIALVIRRYAKGLWTYETSVHIGATPFFLKVDGSGKVLERRRVDTQPARTAKARRSSPRPRPEP
jgi:hypothetical protein